MDFEPSANVPTDLAKSAYLVEYFVALALLLVFLACFSRKSDWMLADLVGSIFFGVTLLLAPDLLCKNILRIGDHQFEARLAGAILFGGAFLWMRCRLSQLKVQAALLQSHVLASAMVLLAMVGDLRVHDSEQAEGGFLRVAVLGCVLWLVGSLWQFFSNVDADRRTPGKKCLSDGAARLDALATTAVALACYSFPVLAGAAVHGQELPYQQFQMRCVGALLAAQAWVANAATGFDHSFDKIAVLESRLVTSVLLAGVMAWEAPAHYWSLLAALAACAGNAGLGLLHAQPTATKRA